VTTLEKNAFFDLQQYESRDFFPLEGKYGIASAGG